MVDPDAPTTPHSRLSGLRPHALLAQAFPLPLSDVVEVPGYELEAPIGRGGTGTVFLAKQRALDREVAVKVLASDLAGDPVFLERIAREARTMARLRHPNVVTVHDFVTLGEGNVALVMEYVEGGSLREKVRRHPRGLPVKDALRLIGQIAAGLEAAHAAGVVHRDMKPENVLIDHGDTARVTDFGLALPLHEGGPRLTFTGTAMGTLEYMPPEQSRGEEVDARVDVFALGVIAHELLTGQLPRGSFSPPHEIRSEIPRGVSEAVMRALRPERGDRHASIAAFARALEREARSDGRSTWMWWLAGALVLAASIVSAVLLFDREPEQTQVQAQVQVAAPPEPEIEFGPWRNALAPVDVHNDNYGGEWTLDRTGASSNDGICKLALVRDEMPEAYDVRVSFTRRSGIYSVAVFFGVNGSVGSCEIDAWNLGLSGVQMINGKDLRQADHFEETLENGRRYELILEVRPERVRVLLDGVEKIVHALNPQDSLYPTQPWNWRPEDRPMQLGIGSYESPTHFHRVEWRAVRKGEK